MLAWGAQDVAVAAATPAALASDAVLGRAVLGAGLARELGGLLVRRNERGVLGVECRPPLLGVNVKLNLQLVLERAQLLGPPEAADDDCVFVKVTTLAERDAIGRANAIVLD